MVMSAVIERTGPRAFRVIGELDASNLGGVEDVLAGEIGSRGDLTLDLTELTFVDSLGMGLLISVADRLEGDLILVSANHSVGRVIELFQLDHRRNVRITSA